MRNTDVVRNIYRDFAAGNAAAILETFSTDIEFQLAESHPYRGSAGAWIGKQAVVENFFTVAFLEWDGWQMRVQQIVDAGDTVVVEGRYAGLYKPTGAHMDLDVCHVWRFRSAEVASFHQYVDTAQLRRVMGRDLGCGTAVGPSAS